MENWLATIAAIAFLSSASIAQPELEEDPLIEATTANILAIERHPDGSLSGPGWEQLMRDAEAAQFFLIGEQHATADIAEIEAGLQRGLASRGYDHMAVEIGPWSTRFAENLIRTQSDLAAAIRSAPGNGYAIPFLFFAEDAALVHQAVESSPAQFDVLWGLDQEFIAAAPVLLPMLGERARTTAQFDAIAAFEALSDANPMALGAGPPEQFDALRAAFNTGEDQAALELVDAMILSNRIYGPFTGRSGPIYPANLLRENYMKQNFVDHFARTDARDGQPPRVFLKFGANHMMRGRSLTNVPALGDFIVEWGRPRGFDAVNILIDCIGGEAVEVQTGGTAPCESYMLDADSIIHRLTAGRPLTLIDLRPLRSLVRSDSAINQATRDLIFAFDYYLGVANVSPATLIPDPMQLPE